eukprot:TRINITY_DN7593_c0_g1_i2.p2 TRINITY_DN7593_c0_g1~~TRINITY_DN7593_c0_g1_i2.p2  ORF type:complete len:142 (+),score=18.14 TRINITY_DN7593_c0_g1_i2:884-1309(+)
MRMLACMHDSIPNIGPSSSSGLFAKVLVSSGMHACMRVQALTLARYQDKISKRQIYAQALGPLIQSCRLACVAFMSSLFPLGLEYIQDVDPITRLHGLDMMQSLLVQARPRITAKRVEVGAAMNLCLRACIQQVCRSYEPG